MPNSLRHFFGQLEAHLEERRPEPPLRALKALCTTAQDTGNLRELRHAAIELLAQINELRIEANTRSADSETVAKESQSIVGAARALVVEAMALGQKELFTDALIGNAWHALEFHTLRATERATASPNGVFISYRRTETMHFSGRIHDRLRVAFPTVRIFRDVASIPSGTDFPDRIMNEIRGSRVCLVLIGPTWLSCADVDTGCRRLDLESDWVRKEIEAALNLNLMTIPVLIDGAPMPDPRELPTSMQALAYKNAHTVHHDPHFDNDVALLMRRLQELLA